ncbi:MAG: T9SS type A sorting domain-containing protein [Bacteroidota bacterium]
MLFVRYYFLKVYPNPFKDETAVEINSELLKLNPEFIISDVIGNKIASISLTQLRTVINRQELPAGVYFYQLRRTGNAIAIGKMIIIN